MSNQPGEVDLQGSISGPLNQWPLRPEDLRQALITAGAPENALQLVTEGGWLTIEPAQQVIAVSAFKGDSPAQLLSEALEQLRLASATNMDEEWVSTLRLVEFQENSKIEALVGITKDGIQTVGRESPWKAVPPVGEIDFLRKNWKVALALLFAIIGTLYLNRSDLQEAWQKAKAPISSTSSPGETD